MSDFPLVASRVDTLFQIAPIDCGRKRNQAVDSD